MPSPFSLSVDLNDARSHSEHVELLLRLGAVANALLTIGRMVPSTTTTLSDRRDHVHYTILAASYVAEAGRIIDETGEHLWDLLRSAHPLVSTVTVLRPAQLRGLLAPHSPFRNRCAEIRDRYAFHVDSGPIVDWLKTRETSDSLVLETVENGPNTRLFDAAVVMLFESVLNQEEDTFGEQLRWCVRNLPELVRLAIDGFAAKFGIQLRVDPIEARPYVLNQGFDVEPGETTHRVALEIRPKDSAWVPFYVCIPAHEEHLVRPELRIGTSLCVHQTTPIGRAPRVSIPNWWVSISRSAAVPSGPSHLLFGAGFPTALVFGQVGGEQHRVLLNTTWGMKKPVNLPGAPQISADA